jgi:hypothetical protein
MKRFGSRSTFAMEICDPDPTTPDLRIVDVYADGRWLTCADNVVYAPQFAGSVCDDLERVISEHLPQRDNIPFPDHTVEENHCRMLELAADIDNEMCELHENHRFMDWGPTADNVTMHLFRTNEMAVLPFSFWRKNHHAPEELDSVFCATIPIHELRLILHRTTWLLIWDWATLKRQCGGESGKDHHR